MAGGGAGARGRLRGRRPATAEAWGESVSRVECLQSIAAAGNTDVDGPIRCTVYGDEFTIR